MPAPGLSRRRLLSLLAGGAAAVTAACSRRPAAGTTRLVEHYGPGARQLGEWWVPAGDGPLPAVVLVHGGYWRPTYDRHLEDDLAADLCRRGFLVWNVDYAPASWPGTLADTAAAYDALLTGRYASRVDRARVAVVGHSAGGHLALWLASRDRLPAGAPGAGPHLRPALAVPQAPVAALVRAAHEHLGQGAVEDFVGGTPEQVPQRYAVADPLALLPTGVRTVIVHGTGDDVVPLSQSQAYAAASGCELVTVPGGHFEHLDPASEACAALRRALSRL